MPPGFVVLIEDLHDKRGFTTDQSQLDDPQITRDLLGTDHRGSLEQRFMMVDKKTHKGKRVRIVVGGSPANPQLAWTVHVVVTKDGPVYSPWSLPK